MVQKMFPSELMREHLGHQPSGLEFDRLKLGSFLVQTQTGIRFAPNFSSWRTNGGCIYPKFFCPVSVISLFLDVSPIWLLPEKTTGKDSTCDSYRGYREELALGKV